MTDFKAPAPVVAAEAGSHGGPGRIATQAIHELRLSLMLPHELTGRHEGVVRRDATSGKPVFVAQRFEVPLPAGRAPLAFVQHRATLEIAPPSSDGRARATLHLGERLGASGSTVRRTGDIAQPRPLPVQRSNPGPPSLAPSQPAPAASTTGAQPTPLQASVIRLERPGEAASSVAVPSAKPTIDALKSGPLANHIRPSQAQPSQAQTVAHGAGPTRATAASIETGRPSPVGQQGPATAVPNAASPAPRPEAITAASAPIGKGENFGRSAVVATQPSPSATTPANVSPAARKVAPAVGEQVQPAVRNAVPTPAYTAPKPMIRQSPLPSAVPSQAGGFVAASPSAAAPIASAAGPLASALAKAPPTAPLVHDLGAKIEASAPQSGGRATPAGEPVERQGAAPAVSAPSAPPPSVSPSRIAPTVPATDDAVTQLTRQLLWLSELSNDSFEARREPRPAAGEAPPAQARAREPEGPISPAAAWKSADAIWQERLGLTIEHGQNGAMPGGRQPFSLQIETERLGTIKLVGLAGQETLDLVAIDVPAEARPGMRALWALLGNRLGLTGTFRIGAGDG